MEFPANCKYTKEHEWVRVEGSSAQCGITEFAQHELGEIVFVELPAVGRMVKQGDSFCVVESTKAASDVYAPISGKVAAVNPALKDTPGLINSDPQAAGWMVKLEGIVTADVAKLMSAEEYKAFLGDKAHG